MRKSYLLVLFLFVSFGVFAQSDAEKIQVATAEAVDLYGLDGAQAEAMLVIQERRFRNLGQITSLRTTDYTLFLKKMRSIRQGTEATTKRLLNAQQLAIFEAEMQDRRKGDATLIEQLKIEGKSKEEIQMGLLERELN